MGSEDEVEQSKWRPCRQTNGRSKRTCELTSSIVPRGTSFHRRVELEFPPIRSDLSRFSCCCDGLLPAPAELGAVHPDAVHDHGQSARQRDDRLFMPRRLAICMGVKQTSKLAVSKSAFDPIATFGQHLMLQ